MRNSSFTSNCSILSFINASTFHPSLLQTTPPHVLFYPSSFQWQYNHRSILFSKEWISDLKYQKTTNTLFIQVNTCILYWLFNTKRQTQNVCWTKQAIPQISYPSNRKFCDHLLCWTLQWFLPWEDLVEFLDVRLKSLGMLSANRAFSLSLSEVQNSLLTVSCRK